MEYTHIRDCWNALVNAKSLSEMEELSDNFPRWSGDWSFDIISINNAEMTVEVSNICENEESHYNFDIIRCDEDADYYEDFDDCGLASSPLNIVTKECYTKLDEVAKLNESTPNGHIKDADTILADVMNEADFEETGMFEELRVLYHDAYMDSDESKVGLEIFHEMFNLFTGISFSEYLDRCKENITRGENND